MSRTNLRMYGSCPDILTAGCTRSATALVDPFSLLCWPWHRSLCRSITDYQLCGNAGDLDPVFFARRLVGAPNPHTYLLSVDEKEGGGIVRIARSNRVVKVHQRKAGVNLRILRTPSGKTLPAVWGTGSAPLSISASASKSNLGSVS